MFLYFFRFVPGPYFDETNTKGKYSLRETSKDLLCVNWVDFDTDHTETGNHSNVLNRFLG